MSLAFEINVRDRATTELGRLAAAMESDLLDDYIGVAVTEEIQAHLIELDSERPNQLGGRRTHWYAEAGEGTTYEKQSDGVTISIVQEGIRTRILGTQILPEGAIVPVEARLLAIPASAETYGKRPSEFDDLVFMWGRGREGEIRPIALVQGTGETVDAESGGVKRSQPKGSNRIKLGEATITSGIFFWLTDRVEQDPDPSIIPTEEEMRGAAYEKLDDFFMSFQGAING